MTGGILFEVILYALLTKLPNSIELIIFNLADYMIDDYTLNNPIKHIRCQVRSLLSYFAEYTLEFRESISYLSAVSYRYCCVAR